MAIQKHRLTALFCQNVKTPGRHNDGDGLGLNISKSGAKHFSFRYRFHGPTHELGLGSYPLVTLAEAREAADEARRLLRKGISPVAEKRAKVQAQRLAELRSITFQEAALAYASAHPEWSASHAHDWKRQMEVYTYPIIGALPVDSINTAAVLRCLTPIWTSKTDTARRVRSHIEKTLDHARVAGQRSGENPARWSSHLQHALASPAKLAKAKHRESMPYPQLPAFMQRLREQQGTIPRALEFAILTCARRGEINGMVWSEVDFERKEWVVPASRYKSDRDHIVLISDRALEILREQWEYKFDSDILVFAGMGSHGMYDFLRQQMNEPIYSAHGMRSTFRTWASERCPNYQSEIAELCLGHAIGSELRRIYDRAEHISRRRQLLAKWATYCESTPVEPAQVLPYAQPQRA